MSLAKYIYFLHGLFVTGSVRRRDEEGQATAEYALVLLGAAAVALAIVSWASRTDFVGKLLDVVFKALLGKAR